MELSARCAKGINMFSILAIFCCCCHHLSGSPSQLPKAVAEFNDGSVAGKGSLVGFSQGSFVAAAIWGQPEAGRLSKHY